MLSAVVLTHNEENTISECLSLLSFCDERLVIDDNSTDNTVKIAKKAGAKVVSHSLVNDFSSQRNLGQSLAKGDWILFIDADERVDKRLQNDIKKAVQQKNVQGYYLKRRDYLWGKPLFHGESGYREIVRLAKKNSAQWVGNVHEEWKVKGQIGVLHHYLLHYPHQDIVEFLHEVNYYTTIRAQELMKQGVQVNWWDIILYPKVKFFQNYFIRLGFLDGVRGLVVAIIMSFHSFLVRGKVWELQKKK